MQVDRIKFSKEFFVLGAGEWVTMEAQLQENEDPCEAIKELKQKMISMYGYSEERNGEGIASIPALRGHIIYGEPKVINRAYERMRDEIADCKTIEELAKLKPDLPTDLMPDYMNQLKKLTKQIENGKY